MSEPDSDLDVYMKDDLEEMFNTAMKKHLDLKSKPRVNLELIFHDVSEDSLKRTNKYMLLSNILCYLAEMATLMHRGDTAFSVRNGAICSWSYPKGDKAFRILNATEWREPKLVLSKDIMILRDKVVIVLNYLTKVMESEKQELRQEDITTLTTLEESLRNMTDIIILESVYVFEKVGQSLGTIKSILQSANTHKLFETLWKMERKKEEEKYEERRRKDILENLFIVDPKRRKEEIENWFPTDPQRRNQILEHWFPDPKRRKKILKHWFPDPPTS